MTSDPRAVHVQAIGSARGIIHEGTDYPQGPWPDCRVQPRDDKPSTYRIVTGDVTCLRCLDDLARQLMIAAKVVSEGEPPPRILRIPYDDPIEIRRLVNRLRGNQLAPEVADHIITTLCGTGAK